MIEVHVHVATLTHTCIKVSKVNVSDEHEHVVSIAVYEMQC